MPNTETQDIQIWVQLTIESNTGINAEVTNKLREIEIEKLYSTVNDVLLISLWDVVWNTIESGTKHRLVYYLRTQNYSPNE